MISTELLYELIADALEDLHQSQLLTSMMYRKKQNEAYIVRMINQADIAVMSELRINQEVQIFAKKGLTRVPLRTSAEHIAQQVKGVVKGLIPKAPIQGAMLLDAEPWLDVSHVTGSTLYVYSESQPDVYGTKREFELSPYGQLHDNRGASCAAYADVHTGTLRLARPLESDAFLLIEAEIRPSKIDFGKDSDEKVSRETYRVRTPDYAQDWLKAQTLKAMLPPTVFGQSGYAAELQAERLLAFERRPGRPATAYTVEGNYDF